MLRHLSSRNVAPLLARNQASRNNGKQFVRAFVTSRTPVSKNKVAWQAEENEDIQRVTQKAIVSADTI